jgi:hypothetical protein
MAGAQAERQETGLIDAINSGYGKNGGKPFTIVGTGGDRITDCVRAEKFTGRSRAGTEPYTDVIIHRTRNRVVNISMKGTSAPSIAGGGLSGLEEAAPGLTGKFLNAALSKYQNMGFQEGMSDVPDMYGKVGVNLKEQIVVGNADMGGPIDYMYVGPMNVTSSFSGGTMRVNGKFTDAKKYAKQHDIYLRLRKRRADQPFTEDKDNKGMPLILGRSPSRGDKGRRIVTTTKTPANAEIVEF